MTALLLAAAVPCSAMDFGLGRAVARSGAAVIAEAEEADLHATTGDNAAQSLPSCGSGRPYSVLPTDLSIVAGIVPLGNVNPSGHTFPTDHIYFYMTPLDALNPTGPRNTATVVAPGNVLVTEIATSEYLSANPPFTDYQIYFYGCREVKSYVSHIETLDPAFQAQVGPIRDGCSDYATGGTTIRRCQKNMAISVSAGTPLGTSGPPHTVSFDFGTVDFRRTLSFVSPQRRGVEQRHTACPIDYFEDGPKGQMEALLGRFDGGARRTQAPVCGSIEADVANTAQGYWYRPGAPDSPEDPHLSLAPDNVYPMRQNLASGTSVPGFRGFVTFAPTNSGFVNRDLREVTADGNVYCYDTFVDPLGQPAFTGWRALITMPTPTTLQFEKSLTASCGSGPWTLSGAAVTFQR